MRSDSRVNPTGAPCTIQLGATGYQKLRNPCSTSRSIACVPGSAMAQRPSRASSAASSASVQRGDPAGGGTRPFKRWTMPGSS